MGDNSCCDICQSKTTLEYPEILKNMQDPIYKKHLEDVLDPKAYVRDKREPVTFGDGHNQIVVKCGNSGESSGVMKRNPVPLRQYKLEEDFIELKECLDQNVEEIQKLGKRQHQLRSYVKHIMEDIGERDLWKGLSETNYVGYFHTLLWIEEHYDQKELERHNQRDAKLVIGVQDDGPLLYGIDVFGLSDGRPSIIENDIVRIHKENDAVVDEETKLIKYHVYESRIEDMKKEKDEIYVAPHPAKFEYQLEEIVGVEFMLNRRPFQLSHRALDQLKKDTPLFRTLFPKKEPKHPAQQRQLEMELVNKKISNDEKQMQAITNILRKSSGSAPYILIGPPGTGKTATLVEVIHQLFKRKSTSELPRICICAPSNPAVDVIVKRLLGLDRLEDDRPILPSRLQENVIRIYAKSCEQDEDLEDYCTNEVHAGELVEKRIIAVTTLTAGRLIDKGFGKNWFDYLFIDEAGQGTETNILIPIAGFMDEKCFLVLAGDPKQLGPVITSPLAKALGLEISLIERLRLSKKNSIYRGKSAHFSSTILQNNYRSHPRIINIPNKLFYDGQLKAKGETKRIFLASDSVWEQLSKRNNNFPIIFHGVTGKQRNSGNSPSFFNMKEIFVMNNYIADLLGRVLSGVKIVQDHIGIISPYRTQVEMIKKFLNHRNWNGIRAGSIESFQGSEKLIIIISTVRSKKIGSEFLRNERRFNVAITRAMALLIVIGNPEVLYMRGDDRNPNHWRDLIDECYRFHSCKGTLPQELQKK